MAFTLSISKPTRITSSSATLTCIDNIFTSNREYNMVCGILYTDISDHLPLYQMTNLKLTKNPPPPQVKLTCIINPFHINNFRSKLADVDWSFLDSSDSPNDCYNIINHLQTLYKECFPLKPGHGSLPDCLIHAWGKTPFMNNTLLILLLTINPKLQVS